MVSWFPLPLPYTLWFNYSDRLFCFTSTSLKMQFPLPEAATTTTTSSHTKWPAKILGKKQVESESPSHLAVSDSLQPHRLHLPKLLCPWTSPDNNTAVGSHSLLQGIFPTWGPNLGLPHCSLLSGLPGKPLLMFKAQIWKFMSFVPHLPHHFHPSSAQFTSSLSFSLSLDSLHWLNYNACCSIAVKNIHFAKSYASG